MGDIAEVRRAARPARGAPRTVGPDADDHLAFERTPIPITARTRTVLAVAAVLALAWLVWAAPSVPRLVVTGAALALVLSFPVRLLARVVPRGVAIALVVVGLLLLTLLTLVVLIPLGIVQLTDLVRALPGYAEQADAALRRGADALSERGFVSEEPDRLIADARAEILSRAQGVATGVVARVVNALAGTLGLVIQLFGVVLVAVYLLADIGRFKGIVLGVAPPSFKDDVAELWGELERSLSRYLGGLLVSMAAQGVAAAVALWLLGVPYPLLLGLWMAATAVLPYVGAFLGAIPAVAVALFVSPTAAALTAVAYLVINQVDGNLLTPRIQGEAVRVHPLLVFLGVVAGGEIGGLLGAALAAPTMAILRVLVDFFGDRLYVPRPAAVGRGGAAALGAGRLERDADAAGDGVA